MAILVNSQTVIFNDRTVKVSSGATRPASPVVGMFWYNTSLSQLEVWNGTEWRPQNTAAAPISQGVAYSWGRNNQGQIGDNSTASRSSPVSVVGGFTDWTKIDGSGYSHAHGIRANGTAWGWGFNGSPHGPLGDGTSISRSSPVSVKGGFTDWVDISCGGVHTAAVRANGTAWCWGNGGSGQIGNGFTTFNPFSPVSVIGGFTDWVSISCGDIHTVAVRANGTAYAWGGNGSGRLGNNSTVDRSSPVLVAGGFTDWEYVASFREHNIGIRANGTAWCWGVGSSGQLGDNSTASRSSPVSVVGGFTDWVQGATGFAHTLAVRANGTAYAWGSNAGKLGNNSTANSSSPVLVVGGFTDWVQVGAGAYFSNGVRANGTAWGWGGNSGYSTGALGNNSTVDRSSPVSVAGGFTDWVYIAGGRFTAHAIRG